MERLVLSPADVRAGDNLRAFSGPLGRREIEGVVTSVEREGWGYSIARYPSPHLWFDYADTIEVERA